MKHLHYDDLDIVGFGGLRENILVMDSRVFGYRRSDDAWQGRGPLTYLAHAFFRPGGSTGRHSHSDVTIVSVITRGRIRHEGDAGWEGDLHAGQVMIQRSGSHGFSHNEINPDPEAAGMVQLWCLPDQYLISHDQADRKATTTVVDVQPGNNPLLQQDGYQLSIEVLAPFSTLSLAPSSLAYIYEGALWSDALGKLSRGSLIDIDHTGSANNTDATLTSREEIVRVITLQPCANSSDLSA